MRVMRCLYFVQSDTISQTLAGGASTIPFTTTFGISLFFTSTTLTLISSLLSVSLDCAEALAGIVAATRPVRARNKKRVKAGEEIGESFDTNIRILRMMKSGCKIDQR